MHVYTYTHIRMYAHIHKLLNIEEPSGPPEHPAAQLSPFPRPPPSPRRFPPSTFDMWGAHMYVWDTHVRVRSFSITNKCITWEGHRRPVALIPPCYYAQTMRKLCAYYAHITLGALSLKLAVLESTLRHWHIARTATCVHHLLPRAYEYDVRPSVPPCCRYHSTSLLEMSSAPSHNGAPCGSSMSCSA